MLVKNKLTQILKTLPASVKLVAVSKTKPNSVILEAYDAGQRDFGENRIQDMVEKFEQLPKDINWHMIGHLQRNKVKYMAEFVHLIHGVDSFKTLKEINKQAKKYDRTINCLLQLKIAEEDSKFGLDKHEVETILTSEEFKTLENVNVIGLMGMATFTENKDQIRNEFKFLKNTFDELKALNTSNYNPTTLSMGMSGDYTIAIEEGSTMVRVGSAIFGERN